MTFITDEPITLEYTIKTKQLAENHDNMQSALNHQLRVVATEQIQGMRLQLQGGYDSGYSACPCFWGTTPATWVTYLARVLSDANSPRALDVGCGDGKNAYYLASHGFRVDAFDISELAIDNARKYWPNLPILNWSIADIRTFEFKDDDFDAVIATGSLHCLNSELVIRQAIANIKRATRNAGYNVISVFNNRSHDFAGHDPDFEPTLMCHNDYVALYSDWKVLHVSDLDLTDWHEHTKILHHHSITRIFALRP
jgi:SAM-dependent methyltransferase